jgi:predicted transposase/invertase (TIGR01784 family)
VAAGGSGRPRCDGGRLAAHDAPGAVLAQVDAAEPEVAGKRGSVDLALEVSAEAHHGCGLAVELDVDLAGVVARQPPGAPAVRGELLVPGQDLTVGPDQPGAVGEQLVEHEQIVRHHGPPEALLGMLDGGAGHGASVQFVAERVHRAVQIGHVAGHREQPALRPNERGARMPPTPPPMYADLKNDFVFRRVFGAHPDLLAALLDDLLELSGDERIDSLEYLPSEQVPEIPGFKLSIVDVKCRQKTGRVFVVEMQLAHFTGFVHRMVYNASKAYVQRLPEGGAYHTLSDVVAVSICDFAVFPDRTRRERGLPLIPMLSRWRLTERHSGADDAMGQVQYVFLELPKVTDELAQAGGAGLWAWLFRNAEGLEKPPEGLPEGPHARALALANEQTFTESEREAYRKLRDEIFAALSMAREAEARGEARGEAKGLARGLREAVTDLCEAHGIEVDDARRALLSRLDLTGLEALRAHVKSCRAWPGEGAASG